MIIKRRYNLLDSFVFAFKGVFRSVSKERNLKIHFSLTALALIMGTLLKISYFEWLILLIIISVVISAEIFNTAIEAFCNLMRARLNLNYYETYWIRNFSAAAVLVLAIGALIAGLIIFLPKIF